MWKRKNAQFFFTSQRQRANTSVFFEICGFLLYWVLVLYLSFRAGIYGTKTGLFSRKIKFVIFDCSFASIAAALRRRTFFARTKKLPKKYAEGVRTLSTPGDAVKFLRFDGDTGNFAVSSNARKHGFSLPFSDCGLTQAEFYEIFEFLLYRGFGLMSEFSYWNLRHENGQSYAED